MRRNDLFAIILMVAAVPGGVALMAAPEYLHLTGIALAITFWGGVLLTLLLLFLAIAVALRGEAKSPPSGHRRRMFALIGMTLFGLGFVACAVVFFLPQEAPKKAPDAESAVSVRGPTLEATNNSKINADGAVIPGDLPFQFGRADDHSTINMRGVIVTQRPEGGYTITPGHSTFVFPSSGEFSKLSNAELKGKAKFFIERLTAMQKAFNAEVFEGRAQPMPYEESRIIYERMQSSFQNDLASDVISLCAEVLSRIGPVDGATLPQLARHGAMFLRDQRFAGPLPAKSIADFVEVIAKKLPA